MLDGVRDVQLLILTALAAEPMHGHRMQSEIEALSGRPVGPGTLYGAINRLEDDGFIRRAPRGDAVGPMSPPTRGVGASPRR